MFVGEWKNRVENSNGIYTFFNGRKYFGEYKDGLPHGQGTYTFWYGGKFIGIFNNGAMWNGKFYDKDGKFLGRK